MKITIEGEPKEIAALVSEVQERQENLSAGNLAGRIMHQISELVARALSADERYEPQDAEFDKAESLAREHVLRINTSYIQSDAEYGGSLNVPVADYMMVGSE